MTDWKNARWVPPEDTEESPPFTVDTPQKADWCLRKLAEADAELQRWTTFYDNEIQRAVNEHDRTVEFFRAHLQAWFATQEHKVTKTSEKVALPSGELILKQQPPEYVRDNDAMVEWCKRSAHQSLIQAKYSVNWAALKKDCMVIEGGRVVIRDTGEVVDGVTAEAREPVFEVKIREVS